MARYPNGQPVRLSTTVVTLAGVLTDDSVTLTVQKPDATTQTYSTPTKDSTGTYHQDIPSTDLTQNGHYLYKWVAPGAGNLTTTPLGDFDVFDPFEPAVLPLADAKDALNISATTTAYDTEISAYLATIESMLEKLVGGPIVNRTISNERVRQTYTNPRLVLRNRIVQSVTSIVDEWSGASLAMTDIVYDQITNTVSRKGDLPFLFRGPWCLVTYVAGFGTSIPAAFNTAARIILQHLWQTQRGPGMAPVPNMDETFLPGMGYAIPNRALEILSDYLLEVYV